MRRYGTVQKRKNPLGGGLISRIAFEKRYLRWERLNNTYLSIFLHFIQTLSPIKKSFIGATRV